MSAKMGDPAADVIPWIKMKYQAEQKQGLSPFDLLIHEGILRMGQKLCFKHQHEGSEHLFQGRVGEEGIEVDGEVHNVSYAAAKCLRQIGVRRAVNGFFAWQTEEGVTLADLYQCSINNRVHSAKAEKMAMKFYKYPDRRDVVFIFGAGASYADGAPLQKDLIPLILSADRESETIIYKIIKEFLTDNFVWDDQSKYYPTLEQVFGFMDYFLQKNESLNSKYSLENIRIIREALIQVVHHTISNKTEGKSKVYRMFWDAVYRHNSNISAITLNYDTFLEDAFLHLYPLNFYLDYCMHLANYDYGDGVDESHWWVNPRESILTTASLDPISCKIIKVHGSLNWRYCNCCNSILLTPWDKRLILKEGELSRNQSGTLDYPFIGHNCGWDQNRLQTLLVPPSHIKNLTHPVFSHLFIEASNEIRRAKRVVFVGYSLPEADVHIRAILKKSLRPDTEVIIIDLNESSEFKLRCKDLSSRVEFIHEPFEVLVGSEELLARIFS